MSLRGLPDFKRPVEAEKVRLFHPFEQGGPYLALPRRLRIADKQAGVPSFHLRIVRGTNPSGPPEPYGVIDLTVEPDYALSSAAAHLRQEQIEASVAPVTPEGGWLRLQPLGGETLFPESLRRALPLEWSGFGATRVAVQLSLEAAHFLEQALLGEMLLLPGTAEVYLRGIAVRSDTRVSFDPAELLAALRERAVEGVISREKARAFFAQPLAELPLKVDEQHAVGPYFAAAMIDRIFERFGTPAAPRAGSQDAHVHLSDEVREGRFRWDLGEAIDVRRSFFYELDLVNAAHRVLEALGRNGLVEEIIVSEMDSGVLPVSVLANLPRERVGMLEMGVTLHAAPNPPKRVHSIQESVRFMPPDDQDDVVLRFAPTEDPLYQVTPYAILRTGRGITRLSENEYQERGTRLFMGPDDFPLRFVRLDTAPGLRALAPVKATVRWKERKADGQEARQQVQLDGERTTAAIALPRNTQEAELLIELTKGDQTVTLDPLPAEDIYLDLPLFPGYGSKTVEIHCEFARGVSVYALELQQETEPEDPEQQTVTLTFATSQSTRMWSYFADSPFAVRYRWRPLADENEPLPWSAWRSPREPLHVRAEASTGNIE